MDPFPLFSLPRPLIDIVCDYHDSFIFKLVDEAIAREDRETCLFFKTHLPTHRFGVDDDLEALLDHCPTCESTLPFPISLYLALDMYSPPYPHMIEKCLDKGCIHIMWLCVDRGYFAPDAFFEMVIRLQLDAENLQKLFEVRVLTARGLKSYLNNTTPWPELVKWFNAIGWRFSKKQRMQ